MKTLLTVLLVLVLFDCVAIDINVKGTNKIKALIVYFDNEIAPTRLEFNQKNDQQMFELNLKLERLNKIHDIGCLRFEIENINGKRFPIRNEDDSLEKVYFDNSRGKIWLEIEEQEVKIANGKRITCYKREEEEKFFKAYHMFFLFPR